MISTVQNVAHQLSDYISDVGVDGPYSKNEASFSFLEPIPHDSHNSGPSCWLKETIEGHKYNDCSMIERPKRFEIERNKDVEKSGQDHSNT